MEDVDQMIKMGDAAELLKENTAYLTAIERIKTDSINDFMTSDFDNIEQRQAAYFMLKAVEKLDAKLQAMIFNSKFEKEKLKRKPN